MLVNATNMLLKARDGHYGVGQFNINNLEWTRSILLQAQAMQGSKCQDINITRLVVELKSEIEKIREQIQNIE